eukprot:c6200_g1_i1.p1 GENE.c6200_g1_i1~~c6200_g1_i1.p1  ORF type:complete len:316 (+),score=84.51 c6200_g1_i1:34-948(+)
MNHKFSLISVLVVATICTSAIPLQTKQSLSLNAQVDPNALITQLNNRLADLYNSQNFSGIASELYYQGALIIPSDQAELLSGDYVASFFQSLSDQGHANVKLVPLVVLQVSENVIHELGSWTDTAPSTARFYVRWLRSSDDPAVWKVAFNIATLEFASTSSATAHPSVPHGSLTSGAALSNPTPEDIIGARNARFLELYNSQNFTGLQNELYALGSYMVPFTSDAFIPQPNLGSFWQAQYQGGVTNLTIKSVSLFQESPSLIHEIGFAAFAAGSGFYYSRWTYEDTVSLWQYSFDVGALHTSSS